jgi:hypothetical protein
MKVEPEYAQNIIVGVLFQGFWRWYVTDRDWWYLDYTKYDYPVKMVGYVPPKPESHVRRFDIAILNEHTAPLFFTKIADYRTSTRELSEKLIENLIETWSNGGNEIYTLTDFAPTLFVDFDHRHFYSYFPEPFYFENYVPDGWASDYKDFFSLIPAEQRYWIIDGKDYFKPSEVM